MFFEWPFGDSAIPPEQPSLSDLTVIGDPYIRASGTPLFSVPIVWPFGSGVTVGGNLGFSENVDALLTSLNAQFGFNQQPHRFTLTWANRCFDDDAVPNIIGDPVDFLIGDFRIRGRVTHVDLSTGNNGRYLQTSIEDVRKDISRVVIDTYGLFDERQSPASIANNVIDVHHCELTKGINRSPKELRLLREHGASWLQIRDAIINAGGNLYTALPDDKFIYQRLGQDKISSYRWAFRTTPLLDALVKIFTDLAYDLYWSMDEQRLKVVDRQERIAIGVSKIPGINIGDNISQLKLGSDQGERPTSVQIFGGKMEGVIGGGAPSGGFTVNGGTFPASAAVQLDINDNYIFKPAWQGASVFYFGADGQIQEDNPTDDELSAALKGIEWWAQKKANVTGLNQAIASRIDDFIIYPRNGIVFPNLAGHSASGVGLLPNRGSTEDKWVVEWYNRVRNFAQNNYTRTYYLAQSDLFDELDRFDVVDQAWCGLENEIDGTVFNTGYKIKDTYKHLAPFWNEDSNKLRAWMFINGRPLWGIDGKAPAAQFPDWSEDGDIGVYVPIEVEKWNRASNRLNSNYSLLPAQKEDRGLIIRLPNMCWEKFDTDSDVAKLKIPQYLKGKFDTETTFDMTIDPLTKGIPFEQFTEGVNIPIVIYERYGSQKPFQWAVGSQVVGFSRAEVQQRDELVPWNFEPQGTKNTVQLLNLEGSGVALGRVVDRGVVDFLEATAVGLPLVTFDNYGDDDGIASHGITNLSLTKGAEDWWMTRYSAKTHFPQPIQVKPVPEEVMEDFRFALHRINERFNRPPRPLPFIPPQIFDPKTDDGKEYLEFPKRENLEILVTITAIIPITLSNGINDIAYAGEDDKGVTWPAAYRAGIVGTLNPASKLARFQNAFAVDGFFQKGMQATYHYEELDNGDVVHYFTGGIALSQARVVKALSSPQLINGVWRMDVEIPQEVFQKTVPGTNPPEYSPVTLEAIEVLGARFTDNNNVDTTLSVNSEIMLSGTGNENGNMLKPVFNEVKQKYEINVGDNAPDNQKDKLSILSSSRSSATVQFATVDTKPDLTTGRGGKIQTISSISGGTLFEDQKIIGAINGNPGTQYFVDFVGVEYNQISIGDPCIIIQEVTPPPEDPDVAAVTPTKIRLLTYINKPLFMATDAFGQGI